MSSEADQRAEQIQANVAAALSRLRGEPADPVLAAKPRPASESAFSEGGPASVSAPDARQESDHAFSARPFSGDLSGIDENRPISRLMGAGGAMAGDQPDLLTEAGINPPPLPDFGDADAEAERDRRRRRNRRLAVAGIVILALIGLWRVIPDDLGPEAVPVITAEATPEKVKPADEGGLQIPNQDVAILNEPAEGEQVTAETVLPPPEQPIEPANPPTTEAAETAIEIPAVPAPEELPTAAAPEAATDTAVETPATVEASTPATIAAGSVRVQLAALQSEEAARKEWDRLQKAMPDLLGGLSLHIERVDKGADGIFFRVQAEPLPDKAAAKKLCADLKLQNQACIVAN
jgi:cell division septation protein DedD